MIKKTNKKWRLDLRPNGHAGKRIIRLFDTKAEALNFQNHILAQTAAGKEWNPAPKDNRLLSEIIELWWTHHGQTLAAGADQRRILDLFCKALGDPIARTITTEDIHNWRSERLETIKPSTLNTQMISVRGLFNILRKQKLIDYENPAAPIKSIKVHENSKAFLSAGEIEYFLKALDSHPDRDVAVICEICLATGARWGEAMKLHYSEVHPDRITFNNTKTKRSRSVPIERALYEKIMDGRIPGKRLFRSCRTTASRVIKGTLNVSENQATHILRHTFASHFIMNGGNILTLQKLLGHANLDMTLKYAHLAPDYLKEAVNLNPAKIARERIGKDSDQEQAIITLAR